MYADTGAWQLRMCAAWNFLPQIIFCSAVRIASLLVLFVFSCGFQLPCGGHLLSA